MAKMTTQFGPASRESGLRRFGSRGFVPGVFVAAALATAATAASMTGAQAAAQLEAPWCGRDVNAPPQTGCSYFSLQQCLTVVGISGGVCERNQYGTEARPAKSARRVVR